MRVAVVGSGVTGIAAAWQLANAGASVVVYEKDGHVGGHAFTHHIDSLDLDVDLGFMVFNTVTYPNLIEFFDELEVPLEPSDMSFSVSVPQCEWGSNGLAGLFAHKRNTLRPAFWRMIREMVLFQDDVLQYLRQMETPSGQPRRNADLPETLGEFLDTHGYSSMFKNCYLIPVCASIWSCGSEGVLSFSAYSVLSFLRNHHMLQVLGRPQWLTVKGRSHAYVKKAVDWISQRGGEFRTNTAVTAVTNTADGKVLVEDTSGGSATFEACVMAVHAPDALTLLGDQATSAEAAVLSAFEYSTSEIFLHGDAGLMPQRRAAWSAWNFRGNVRGRVCVTYWLNALQNLGNTGDPVLITLNPERTPSKVHLRWTTAHPVPSLAAAAAAHSMHNIQAKRGIVFCGAYQGYGFHEDGFKAGVVAADILLGRVAQLRPNHIQMHFSWWEAAARLAVLLFLHRFIQIGSLQLLEAGGTVHDIGEDSVALGWMLPFVPILRRWFRTKPKASARIQEIPANGIATENSKPGKNARLANGSAAEASAESSNGHHSSAEGQDRGSANGMKTANGETEGSKAGVLPQPGAVHALQRKGVPEPHLTVFSPAFYWKVATRADLGLADAYIEGDFACSQGPAGLLSFLELLIVNRDRSKTPGRKPPKARGWWSPYLLTALVGSAEMYIRHLFRFNNVTNARRNIANHYDLSNEMFSKFLDSSMTYSCGIFKNPTEPLEAAQIRKLHRLIAKAQIRAEHRVLEIGFGWGSMAMEIVRLTGCHVTGITLSKQQLELATERVKQANLEDHITFMLCDYRQLKGNGSFDRIVSCEMLEAVGHEYLGDFFHHCDRLLKMDGLLVVQVITTPEERYEEYRLSSDFIKEYIFPGCCVPSLTALTTAMAESSSFSVEHLENIGPDYAITLLRWLDSFEERREEIMAMGFGPKFIRMWEYYFVYCAIGFKTRTLGDLQIVFSRPGNTASLGDSIVGASLPPLPH